MNTKLEKTIDKKIKDIIKEFNIKEDMLGYSQLYNDLKNKILKEQYNIDAKEIEKNNSETID